MRKSYYLPVRGYTTTTSVKRYLDAWEQVKLFIERKTGWSCYAFDPDLAMCRGYKTVAIPLFFALDWMDRDKKDVARRRKRVDRRSRT